ncbi:MAG: phosphoglucomutase [Spirochaetales bacterium]|uniref:Phosphoglucomutase n=1 Tax=Candidatus Thalassospirochaeta sargassi TaxID=3119039 RepID=A0AAJ1IHV7_9SPIO|nr:phosphoglucomutase [Spirochaetales bacterium]
MADFNSFQESFSSFILSASGFRKIFAAEYGKTAQEDSASVDITAEDATASAIIADVFGSIVKKRNPDSSVMTIAVGMDARPTGPAIASVMVSSFEALGFEVRYSGITAAPELMAWVKTSADIDAFAYISASHNPLGHNGFKFGFSDGAVLGGRDSRDFISAIIAAVIDEDMHAKYAELLSGEKKPDTSALPDPSADKAEAEVAYRFFSNMVISASGSKDEQDVILGKIKAAAAGIGIIAELNGSARGVSIDQDYFESFGFKSRFLNDNPGKVVHAIVPEGASLNLCREELEKANAEDNDFIMGYVPDNDGDRGNIVYINERTHCAEILEAQEVFALCVKSELSFMQQTNPGAKLAVAVNGPTSMRIERIAKAFGAEVFRAEVGEANVVNLAAEKRSEGFEVRILGEGSNGGNITHPATVRDPLNTIFALVKLQIFGGYSSLTEAVESLPDFSTTSAYESEAKMQIGSISHAELKANYEKIFPASFEKRKVELEADFGITGWYEINYEGTSARKGVGPAFRSGKETGGLKIMLTGPVQNEDGTEAIVDKAYLWMRGSGTEPVFRVMTDIESSNSEAMHRLLNWQRALVAMAAGI